MRTGLNDRGTYTRARMPVMARLVTLDVTNTCIRVVKSVGYHYARVAKEFGVSLEVSQVDAAFRAAFKETNTAFPNFGCQHGLTCSQWWKKVVTDTLTNAWSNDKELRLDVIADINHKLYSDFSGADNWEVFPDVHPTLEEVKAAGISLGVVSNFDDRLGTILSSLGLAKYFDFILASYEVKCAKPNPRIFKLALQRAAVDGSKAVHVGDNYKLDYLAAQNAGMRSLLLVRNDKEQGVEAKVISTLKDLLALL